MVIPAGCVPYAPPAEWYASLLRGECPACERRRLNRCSIRSNCGVLQLSVPLAGGGKVLKRTDAPDPEISLHGNWPHLHFGALEANYGREPFFRHFAPALERIYAAPPRFLSELNGEVHKLILKGLGGDGIPQIISETERRPDLFRRRAEELRPLVESKLSALDSLFRLGPEAIFPILLAL